jgi:predicted flap endonuclease-1-like 5' DNA nuclease
MTYPIADLDGIDEEALLLLKSIGIRTTTRLLDAAKGPRDRKRLAERTGFDEKQILAWANTADRMRIKGVGEEYAELLREAGVDTVRELQYRNPGNLSKAMAAANRKRKLVRLLPSENVVSRWIEHARKLPPKIRY